MQFLRRRVRTDADASVGSVGSMGLGAVFSGLIGGPGAISFRKVPSGDESQEGSVQAGAATLLNRRSMAAASTSANGSIDAMFLEQIKSFVRGDDAGVQERSMEANFLMPTSPGEPAGLPPPVDGAGTLAQRPQVTAVHAKLGVGSFGEVFHCTVQGVEGDVAVKVLLKGSDISQKRELELLGQLRHAHLMQFHGVLRGPPDALILELCCGGSLEELLHGPVERHGGLEGLALPARARAMVDVISVVEYLHEQHILHRDIKAGNVFLATPVAVPVRDLPTVKLGDLGLARELGTSMTQCTGTFRYMAPEVLMSESYAEPADIFSCGILLYEVMSGSKPFAGIPGLRVAAAISIGTRPDPADIGDGPIVEALATVLRTSWAEDPGDRPTAAYLRECLEPLVPGL